MREKGHEEGDSNIEVNGEEKKRVEKNDQGNAGLKILKYLVAESDLLDSQRERDRSAPRPLPTITKNPSMVWLCLLRAVCVLCAMCTLRCLNYFVEVRCPGAAEIVAESPCKGHIMRVTY
jgi:hypothetical protein